MLIFIVLALNESIKADHGFNIDSRAIRDLVGVMATYDGPARRAYLQFITGSPRLPVGGELRLDPASLPTTDRAGQS